MLSAFFVAAALAATCPTTNGSELLFTNAMTQFIWVGELHGTNEEPALFGDIVCAASKTGRPVVVALERTQSEQSYWDAYLNSDGGDAARSAFLAAPSWRGVTQDGRSSLAMLELADRLRRYKASRMIVDVKMIVAGRPLGTPYDPEVNEAQMAEGVAAAGAVRVNALVLIYSGNLHARKTDWTMSGKTYTLAAAHLPAARTVSVILMGENGNAWNCQDDGCHSHTSLGYSNHERGIELGHAPVGFDALGYVGLPTTASLPAAPSSLTDVLSGH